MRPNKNLKIICPLNFGYGGLAWPFARCLLVSIKAEN